MTCAILYDDTQLTDRLREYISKMPCLSLKAAYDNPLEALNEYLKEKVDLYFVQLGTASEKDIDGMEFSRLLSVETRVVFVAQDGRHAARCFQLDALDYLTDVTLSSFFQAMNKVVRWFSHSDGVSLRSPFVSCTNVRDDNIINIRSEYRIVRLHLDDILYVEGMGDYVKIYTRNVEKPFLTLCSMKSMETRLPEGMFLRIHHSFIVNREHVESIERTELTLAGKHLPVGDVYRERLKQWIARLAVL